MKYYRTHNTQLQDLEDGWPTKNKKGEVIIYDEVNGYAFSITFGKKPEISIWDESDNQNLGNEIHRFKVGQKELTLPSIEMDDLAEAINLVLTRKSKK